MILDLGLELLVRRPSDRELLDIGGRVGMRCGREPAHELASREIRAFTGYACVARASLSSLGVSLHRGFKGFGHRPGPQIPKGDALRSDRFFVSRKLH